MNISFLITWIDFGLLVLAFYTFWRGYKLGKRNGRQEGFRESYQTEVNNKMEEFIYDQKKNG